MFCFLRKKPNSGPHGWLPGEKNEKRRKKEFGVQPKINSAVPPKMRVRLIFI